MFSLGCTFLDEIETSKQMNCGYTTTLIQEEDVQSTRLISEHDRQQEVIAGVSFKSSDTTQYQFGEVR